MVEEAGALLTAKLSEGEGAVTKEPPKKQARHTCGLFCCAGRAWGSASEWKTSASTEPDSTEASW